MLERAQRAHTISLRERESERERERVSERECNGGGGRRWKLKNKEIEEVMDTWMDAKKEEENSREGRDRGYKSSRGRISR